MLKLVYKRSFFDISTMSPGARVITTITSDGVVVRKEYASGSRKACAAQKGKCAIEDYKALCAKIEECIAHADRLNEYVDDSSEELKIYHRYGRIQIVDRGLGDEYVHIGAIMNEFLDGAVNYDYVNRVGMV